MNRQSPSQSFSQEVEPIAQNFPKTAEFENKLFPRNVFGGVPDGFGNAFGADVLDLGSFF